MINFDSGIFTLFSIPRFFKRVISSAVDFFLLHLAFFSSIGVLNLPLPNAQTWLVIGITTIATQIALYIMGFYSSVTRYLNIKYIIVLIFGAFFAQFLFKVLTMRLETYPTFWFSEMVVTSMVICVLLGGIRVVVLSYFNHYMNRQKENVVIYGGGSAGHQLALSLLTDSDYFPVAFIDDDKSKQGTSIRGIKVQPFEKLNYLVQNHSVGLVLLALPKISKSERQEIIEKLADYSLAVKTVPRFKNLLSGRLSSNDFQDVEVEDLLGRDPVTPQPELLIRNIENKVVMVTGAGGSIGSELCRQIIQLNPNKVLLVDTSEFALYTISQELQKSLLQLNIVPVLLSVQNKKRLKKIIHTHKVQTIYHAAAYKHVPLVEYNSIAGVMNNVCGTHTLAQAAVEEGVEKFVLISTDKAVRPTNMMGASKRMAELILQAFDQCFDSTSFSMVRFGNVLGSSGSVVPLFKQQILSGGPVTVTHKDIIRYFMTIPEAAQLVIQAGAMGEGGDVFVLDMGEPVQIKQLAERMIYLMGYKLRDEIHPQGEIEIEYTGLRPGEKLFEELLVGDNVTPTSHSRIMRAHEDRLDWSELEKILNDVMKACEADDYEELREIFLRAPLQFQPSSEVFDVSIV